MKLTVVNSGSSGNSYILTADNGEVLLLELGVRFNDIKKALKFDLSKVSGAIISHSHLDHCKGVREAVNSGIDVYCLQETIDSFAFKNHRLKPIVPLKGYKIGSFTVKGFPLNHDVPILGFMLRHDEMGNTIFITDTYFCEYVFEGMNNLILEANYCQQILDQKTYEGKVHGFLRNRIMQSHMSLDSTKEFLKANDLSAVNNIILIHLSDSNSDAVRFKKEVKDLTRCNVEIATKSLSIRFDKTPF